MKSLFVIFSSVVALAAVPASAPSVSPSDAPAAAPQQPSTNQRDEYRQRIEQQRERATLRLQEVTLAFNRVFRATGGGKLSADRIESTPNGVSLEGNVTLTFNGGVIAAAALVVQDDGVVRVIGDSQVTLTPNK